MCEKAREFGSKKQNNMNVDLKRKAEEILNLWNGKAAALFSTMYLNVH